ncbi:hypothetical protein UFOVP1290_140 [uncultured Caudovirales phage]|uniref:Uncharacterized protein n=1 Tax=uncultured Caudovirales phage TaxID=2100421 RepID=A0A6J5RGE1_9CAUD|nr:hypothetical protein UFOVP1290_140 [uncultured Caudovirales phage]
MNISCFCNNKLIQSWNPNPKNLSLACHMRHSYINIVDNLIVRYDLFIPSIETNSSRKIVSYHNNTAIYLYDLDFKTNFMSKILFQSNSFIPLPIKNNIIQINFVDKLIKLNAFA